MLYQAAQVDPANPVYQWTYYTHLDDADKENRKQIERYPQMVLAKGSAVK